MAESFGLCLLPADDDGSQREINGLTAGECAKLGGEYRGGPDASAQIVHDVRAWRDAGHPLAEVRFRAEKKYGRAAYERYLEHVADLAEVNTHGHKAQRKGLPTSGVRAAASPGIPPRASVNIPPLVEAAMRRRGLL